MPFEKGNTIGRQFKSGQSGNPVGKPLAIRQVAEAARPMTMEMLGVLYTVATDKEANSSARVSAAVAVLDRAWGKAPASVTLTHDNVNPKELTNAYLAAIIAAADAGDSSEDPAPSANGSGKPN